MPLRSQPENALLEKIHRAFSAARRTRGGRRARALGDSLALGMGDDAALFLPTPGRETILTCDWFLESTHFLRDQHPADALGWKSLARAVSDIAAMGGEPRCFLLSLALPRDATGRWLDAFLIGLRRAAKRFSCPLAGGDSTQRREILINITVIGEVRKGRALRRDRAKPGDLIYVSGHLGEAEQGWRQLRKRGGRASRTEPGLKKHLYPEPRLALAAWLGEKRLATAAMDLSDGLSTDLPRLCSASRVGAIINPAGLPTVRSAAASAAESTNLALNGGDDYELLFTVSPAHAKKMPASFAGIPITQIGEITKAKKILLSRVSASPQILRPRGWDPFR
jgi:thiamine-monophosphate kinase